MQKQILINASNLHGGGATQVAVSLIHELSKSDRAADFTLLLSTFVHEESKRIATSLDSFKKVVRKDIFGYRRIDDEITSLFGENDIVFTVFGPIYFSDRPKKSIVGFAQPWIIYPNSDAYYKLTLIERVKVRIKYFLQKKAFARNSDVLIVEAGHVKERLSSILPAMKVCVVPNALNAVFRQALEVLPDQVPSNAQLSVRVGETKCITLGFVGRAYSHKNLSILPAVRRALKKLHGIDATIKVTLPPDEWQGQAEEFQAEIENVGSLSLQECVEFYQTLDGVLFPSLLECFSATPLEALAMGLPLFASDRPFVRDFCKDYPFYFDPLDPESVANAVAESIALSPASFQQRLEAGRAHVLSLPTALDRAQRTIEILLAA